MKNEELGDKKMNIIEVKSFEFAVHIVKFTKKLKSSGVEYALISQLLKSGTSIGANVSEAQNAQSKNDFISKMSIALKESRETMYWLRLLKEAEGLQNVELLNQINEIISILTKIVKNSKIN